MLNIVSLCHTVCIRSKGFEVGSLNLLKCSFLLFDVCTLYGTRSSVIRALLVQLPVICLYIDDIGCHKSICDTFVHPANVVLGLPIQPPQWKDLQRIVFRGTLWFDENLFPGNPGDPRISFSEWSFRILVIELAFPQKVEDAIRALEVFLDLRPERRTGDFPRSTERIEFRVCGQFAGEFEKEVREDVERRVGRGLTAFEKRVASLMVFVGENGEERRLIEEQE